MRIKIKSFARKRKSRKEDDTENGKWGLFNKKTSS
jgi:hypothetical protein